MAAPRNRKHIVVPRSPRVEEYKPHPRKIDIPKLPAPASRAAHGAALRQSLNTAEQEALSRRQASVIRVQGAEPGFYVEFSSQPGIALEPASLEDKRKGIELVALTETETPPPNSVKVQRATVFVPEGKLKHFGDRLQRYANDAPRAKQRELRYEDLGDRVASIRLATLEALWTDTRGEYPQLDDVIWWEIWLRRTDKSELDRFIEFARQSNINVGERRLGFDDRIILLASASPRQLAASLDVLNDLAELRKARVTAAPFMGMDGREQAEWAADLKRRMTPPPAAAPAVCVLDAGITREHPLLVDAIADKDVHAVEAAWGTYDNPSSGGHGTQMGGLALYGDLSEHVEGNHAVAIRHRLESVKILPPRGHNDPELYGAVTATAISLPEIQAPERVRCFSMAVTSSEKRGRGQPTSWSAAVDALAAGRSIDTTSGDLVFFDNRENPGRLFVVSAGNVGALGVEYLDRCDTEPVEDPAQSWNALTIGAFTEKAIVSAADWAGWQAVAAPGDLSPWSMTSVTFADSWPLKPDVVFEGGNIATDGNGDVSDRVHDLLLLTTHHVPTERAFATCGATSAASAQAARMAAIIWSEYQNLWPESVRALIVHSARWTSAMQAHLKGASTKGARARLVRRYGFGVPRLDRALRSANDDLTLIVQSSIRPFSDGKMREMHIHELPWPIDELEKLGETPVTLRATLSYFIEPNPGERGWKTRHRYASHGLRFEVAKPTEDVEAFRKRLNKKALAEDEQRPDGGGDSAEWYLGEKTRNKGSIHSDFWVGTAADLASRRVVGVYPVSGWWKELKARDRSHLGAKYSLVVSIETTRTDVDLWTPVATEVGIEVAVETEIEI